MDRGECGRPGSFEEIRAGVVGRLRARRLEIEGAVFARVRDGVPGFAGSEDVEYVAGLRAVVAAVVDYVFEGIEEAGAPSRSIPAVAVGPRVGAPQGEVGVALPTMLGDPRARRARECLRFLVDHPGSSNGEIVTGIGITHQSQISRLLSHLAREGIVVKRSEGPGKRNAWRLTPHGEAIVLALPELRG